MTRHEVVFADAARLARVADGSAALAVTSPPYPMIAMWDALFAGRSEGIAAAAAAGRHDEAFERMHRELDAVWREVYRALAPGGLACIAIGDATRTLGGVFRLFSSHARILSSCLAIGFQSLPGIIWRKTTNAPNKFMGSGMLPAGAYVTLEHEHVLVLRKGARRRFATAAEKRLRAESAFFWEERNQWFSDVWFGLIGADQTLHAGDARRRSGAFPFELAYRLVNMFSVKGDTVLDPFAGTGTTMLAAMASERNSISYEIDAALDPVIAEAAAGLPALANRRIRERLERHRAFEAERAREGRPCANRNEPHDVACVSGQERHLLLREVAGVTRRDDGVFTVRYAPVREPQAADPAC